MKKNLLPFLILIAFSLTFSPSSALAKEKSKWNPTGWLKGEKKGWEGKDVPPGLSEKDAKKAEKEARKKAKEAEKEAKKKEKEAQREAKKAKKEAGKAAEDTGNAVSNAVNNITQ